MRKTEILIMAEQVDEEVLVPEDISGLDWGVEREGLDTPAKCTKCERPFFISSEHASWWRRVTTGFTCKE